MTKEIKEQISAFVDNELSEAEAGLLSRRLGADAALREEAAAMIRLSQLLRNETSVADRHFAARVLAAIHDEPTLADEEAASTSTSASPKPPAWLRIAAGGGIAAAVAVLALNSLPEQTQILAPETTTTAGVVTGSGDSEAVEYVTPTEVSTAGPVGASPELAAYFLSHSASGPSLAPGSGRARMLGGEVIAEDDEVEDAAE